MKKIFSFFICLQMILLQNPCCAAADYIRDDFAESTLSLYKNQIYEQGGSAIEDMLLDKTFYASVQKLEKKQAAPISDTFALNTLAGKNLVRPLPNLNYDYTNIERVFLKLKTANYTTTKDKMLQEGDPLSFYVIEDVVLPTGNKIPKGAEITAQVETISKNGAMGVPADLVVGNFKVKANKEISLTGTIEKTGANRSLWVYPLGYAFLPFFGVGVFAFAIRGGHAKIKPDQVYTVYYR